MGRGLWGGGGGPVVSPWVMVCKGEGGDWGGVARG